MSRSEEIAEFVEDSGGIASAAQIAKAGFLPGSISYALESGAIDKLTRGVYCLPEVFDDEFAAISYRWSKCVLSHGSALMTPLVMMSGTGKNTLPLAQLNFQTQFGTNYNLAFASYLLALIPIVIFYLVCQKQILNGVVNGAVK